MENNKIFVFSIVKWKGKAISFDKHETHRVFSGEKGVKSMDCTFQVIISVNLLKYSLDFLVETGWLSAILLSSSLHTPTNLLRLWLLIVIGFDFF